MFGVAGQRLIRGVGDAVAQGVEVEHPESESPQRTLGSRKPSGLPGSTVSIHSATLAPRAASRRSGRWGPALSHFPSDNAGNRHRVEVELGVQFAGPLLDEMRRAEDREAVGLAAIDQLA